MPSSRVIKVVCSTVAVLAVVGVIAAWVIYKGYRIAIPKYEKLADCTSASLSFPMTVHYHEPYALVLGVPYTSTRQLIFHGEVQFRQRTQIVARIPISSGDMTRCNWLDQPAGTGMAGYILTWGRTERGERLDEILRRGQSYNVEIIFSQPPPTDSSLWLSSIGTFGEP